MLRYAFAIFVFLSGLTLAGAEEFTAIVTSIDGQIVSLRKTTKKKGDTAPPEMKLAVSPDVKIGAGKLNKDTKKFEVDRPLEGGLTNAIFATGKAIARITTNMNKDRIINIVVLSKAK